MSQSLQRTVRIVNPMGMHARPAGKFVEVVGRHDARVRVRRGVEEVDGGSILSLLMLEAAKGTELTLVVTGPEAETTLEALVALVESGFDEADSYEGRGARG